MFKNIFPEHLNRLVYRGGVDKPADAPQADKGSKNVDAKAQGLAALDAGLKNIPESNVAKAHKITEAIFKASGTRTRHEALTAVEAARLTRDVAKEVQALMKDKTELTLLSPNGNTLLVKKFNNGGIVAVAYEAKGNDRADKPAQHVVIGNVPNADKVAFDMALVFRRSNDFNRQEAVAKATMGPRSATPYNAPDYMRDMQRANKRPIRRPEA